MQEKIIFVRTNITVIGSRVKTLCDDTEENFEKLLFIQSKLSHEFISNIIHDTSTKVSMKRNLSGLHCTASYMIGRK